MTDTLVMNPAFGFEELSGEELFEVDGGFNVAKYVIATICGVAGGIGGYVVGWNAGYAAFGSPLGGFVTGVALGAGGFVGGYNAGITFYSNLPR